MGVLAAILNFGLFKLLDYLEPRCEPRNKQHPKKDWLGFPIYDK